MYVEGVFETQSATQKIQQESFETYREEKYKTLNPPPDDVLTLAELPTYFLYQVYFS